MSERAVNNNQFAKMTQQLKKKFKRYENDPAALNELSENIRRYNSFAESHLKLDAESALVKNSCAACW